MVHVLNNRGKERDGMGEVRARVKLANAVDEALVRRGQLAPERVRVYEAEALVDTGAVRCVLPPFVVGHLGLEPVRRYVAQYADGRLDEVDLTEPFFLEIMGRLTSEEALVLGDEILIGQTALEKLDLFVDCRGERLIPNPAHPDQPISKVKRLRLLAAGELLNGEHGGVLVRTNGGPTALGNLTAAQRFPEK